MPKFSELGGGSAYKSGFVMVGIRPEERARLKKLQIEIKQGAGTKLSFYKLVDMAVTMLEMEKDAIIENELLEMRRAIEFKRGRSRAS